MPDYYAILGVPRDAAAEDVKRAYRALARSSHPDANPNDPHAEERFKQVAEAYDVLSDPEKRRRYDAFGDSNASGAFGGFGDLGDVMEAFFGGSPFGRARARTPSSAVAGQDIGVGVSLTLQEAVFGTRRAISIEALARCARCSGDGCEPGTYRARCGRCGGQGEIRSSRQTILGTVMSARPCPQCSGSGDAPSVPCAHCGGQGRAAEVREEVVEIPGGVADGTTLRVRGKGETGVRGGPDGDLYVRIRVAPHEIFERDGDDLVCDLVVPLTQVVLGAEIPVPTLDGEETLRVPAGTSHGTVLRIRGRGATRLDGRGRGDLLVHVSVEIPKHLAADQRELVEKLAEMRGESVAAAEGGLFRRLRDTLRG